MVRTFAWVRGLRGLEPQIITDEAPNILDPKGAAERILAKIEVDDIVTLNQCIAKYPAQTGI